MVWFRDRSTNFLVILEKPSQSEALENALRAENYSHANITTIHLLGHLFELCDLQLYDPRFANLSWSQLANKHLPFIPVNFRRIPKSDNKVLLRKIAKTIESTSIDAVILACDPDNEGMALGFELAQYFKLDKKIVGSIDMSKLDLSSLRVAIHNLNANNWHQMAVQGMSRAEYDWCLGINLTTVASVQFNTKQTIKIGGVKTPTLKLVVERQNEISNHRSTQYHTLKAQARHTRSNRVFELNVKIDGETEFGLKLASDIQQFLVDNPELLVQQIDEKLGLEKSAPKPYSLADLQLSAHQKLNLYPTQTTKAVQQLYQQGYISYPRTDCRFYSSGEKDLAKDIFKTLDKHYQIPLYVKRNNDGTPIPFSSAFDSSKISAHTALSVTSKSLDNLHDLTLLNVYRLIADRYVMQFLPNYKFNSRTAVLKPKNQYTKSLDVELIAIENICVDVGWKRLVGDTDIFKTENEIPLMKNSDKVSLVSVEILNHETKPPLQFNEATLIKAMENIAKIYPHLKGKLRNGIGTPATRLSIIRDLEASNYISVKNGKLYPTQLGEDIVAWLPAILCDPVQRAKMEENLKSIDTSSTSYHRFKTLYKEQIDNIVSEIQTFEKPIRAPKEKHPASQKQIDYAKVLADKCSTEFPEWLINNSTSMSEWISEHKDLSHSSSHPTSKGSGLFSEKQKKIVLDNCEDQQVLGALKRAYPEDYALVSDWIGSFLSSKKSKPKSHHKNLPKTKRIKREPEVIVKLI